jgi:hypothetical protein
MRRTIEAAITINSFVVKYGKINNIDNLLVYCFAVNTTAVGLQ